MRTGTIFYTFFVIVILMEALNLVFKIFNPYYFNLVILTLLTLLTSLLGRHFGIKIGWIVTLGGITLLLIGLLTFIVWN